MLHNGYSDLAVISDYLTKERVMSSGYAAKSGVITLRLGKSVIHKLHDLSLKESVRQKKPVSVIDLIKIALAQMRPDIFGNDI